MFTISQVMRRILVVVPSAKFQNTIKSLVKIRGSAVIAFICIFHDLEIEDYAVCTMDLTL